MPVVWGVTWQMPDRAGVHQPIAPGELLIDTDARGALSEPDKKLVEPRRSSSRSRAGPASTRRAVFFGGCRASLDDHEAPYVVIRGDWQERFACAAVGALLAEPEEDGGASLVTLV